MLKEARFYKKRVDTDAVQCLLCPHFCFILNGEQGRCIIRKNIEGTLYSSVYAEVSSIAVDPVEKKPLYHFYPTKNILSVGTNGCNFTCDFCQNWHISTRETQRKEFTPDMLIAEALRTDSIGIAFTYNEPLVWYEFLYDCAKEFKKVGLKTAIVSNGYINQEPLLELIPFLDAANIDLKGFNDSFYKKIGGSLSPVKKTIETLYKSGICVEVTNLLIPTLNDNEEEYELMCKWLSGVSDEIPFHISAYFPSFKASEPPASLNELLKFKKIAKKYLKYVYTGNIREENDSFCPHCNNLLVSRNGFFVKSNIQSNRCNKCGNQLYFFL